MFRATGEETLIPDALISSFWGSGLRRLETFVSWTSAPPGDRRASSKFLDFRTGLVSELAILTGLTIMHYLGLSISADRPRILYPQLDRSAGEIMLAKTLQ